MAGWEESSVGGGGGGWDGWVGREGMGVGNGVGMLGLGSRRADVRDGRKRRMRRVRVTLGRGEDWKGAPLWRYGMGLDL